MALYDVEIIDAPQAGYNIARNIDYSLQSLFMPSIAVIFSGLQLSYQVLDKAFEKARAKGASLQVLFLSEEPVEEGYFFPSDIDAAESLTDADDAEADDRELLRSKIRLIKDKAKASGIDVSIQVNDNPSVDSILEMVGNAAVIYVDGSTVSREGAADQLFDPEALSRKTACPVEVVNAG